MRTQFRFTVEDIVRHKLYYLRFLIQVVCTVLLFSLCVAKLFSLNSFKNKFRIFEDLSSVYVIRDQTPDAVFMDRTTDADFSDRITAFFEYLSSLDAVQLIAFDQQYVTISGSNSFSDLDCAFQAENGDGIFPVVYTGTGFLETFSFSLTEGRLFSNVDFTKRSTYLPVLLGNQFSRHYKTGDILNDTFQVVGFLEPNAFYLDPGRSSDIVYLDSSIVAPFIVDAESDPLILSNLVGFGALITEDEQILPQIAEKARKLEVFDDLTFISYRDQLASITRETMVMVYIGFLMMGTLLFFCLMCMITTMLSYIDAHKRELAVHLLCGAARSDLTLRLIMPVIVMLILSIIISALVVRDPQTIAAAVVLCSLQLIIVSAFPILKIRNRDISDFLRKNEHD